MTFLRQHFAANRSCQHYFDEGICCCQNRKDEAVVNSVNVCSVDHCFNLRFFRSDVDQGPNFRNFLGRSLEDIFSKESMRIFKTSLETS